MDCTKKVRSVYTFFDFSTFLCWIGELKYLLECVIKVCESY